MDWLNRLIFGLHMAARAMLAPVAFGAAGLVLDPDGKILLVRQRCMPGWRLPGGGVGRGERPGVAVLRELAEEVGLEGGSASLFGLYVRRAGWASNVVALYVVRGGAVRFRPNWEVRAILFADPAAPPPGTTPAALRRLAEFTGAPKSESW